jgi:hypothetical protein
MTSGFVLFRLAHSIYVSVLYDRSINPEDAGTSLSSVTQGPLLF